MIAVLGMFVDGVGGIGRRRGGGVTVCWDGRANVCVVIYRPYTDGWMRV